MFRERREFLGAILPAAFVARAAMAGVLSPQRRGQPLPQPQLPPEPPDASLPKRDPKLLLKQNQAQIQADIKRLYSLAEELKEQVSKTDSAEILSLPLIQKAEEIEKLAKQIKNLARG
jgi:hypothetical protein